MSSAGNNEEVRGRRILVEIAEEKRPFLRHKL
jgi:hypothetical protein